jgi:hypothetical protein
VMRPAEQAAASDKASGEFRGTPLPAQPSTTAEKAAGLDSQGIG